MEIVRRNTELESDHPEYRSQSRLAQMFDKSRAAISKIVRPDNIKKLQQKAAAALDPDKVKKKLKQKPAAGLEPELKRHTHCDWEPTHLELERRVNPKVRQRPSRSPSCGPATLEDKAESGVCPSSPESSPGHRSCADGEMFSVCNEAPAHIHPPGQVHPPGPSSVFVSQMLHSLQFGDGRGTTENANYHAMPHLMPQLKLGIEVKSSLIDGCHDPMSRRVQLEFELTINGDPYQGYPKLMAELCSAFKNELQQVPAQSFYEDCENNRFLFASVLKTGERAPKVYCYYLDQDGDPISISSDHELGVALVHARFLQQNGEVFPHHYPPRPLLLRVLLRSGLSYDTFVTGVRQLQRQSHKDEEEEEL